MTFYEQFATRFKGDPQLQRSALLSQDERYRYRLYRKWADGPCVTFIMLNPSKADALVDDPTVRKCLGFAKRWGMGSLYVGNLFAFRATSPADMKREHDPVGIENKGHVLWMCRQADLVVCAWGAHGAYLRQDAEFVSWLTEVPNVKIKAFGVTSKGQPKHPLMLSYSTKLVDCFA